MTLPKLIVHNIASLDGRLTLAPDVLLLYGDPRWQVVAGEAQDSYKWIMDRFQPQVLLEGSGSLVLPGGEPEPLPVVEGNVEPLYEDYLPENIVKVEGRKWLTIVDSRGAVRWMYKEYPGEEWAGWYLLVLVARDSPAEYLAYLRRERIPYLVAGQKRVDLRLALEKLARKLGVSTVVSTAGGKLNGALLRAGLVDEVSIEFCPALIGGKGTPALFDAAPLGPDEMPVSLSLLEHELRPDGKLWVYYKVKK